MTRLSLSSASAEFHRAKTLIPARRIQRRVKELGEQIRQDYAGQNLTVVALLKGTFVFLADLVRHMDLPLELDFIGAASYGRGTRPGKLIFTKDLQLPVAGRHVLLVDDILDTGATLGAVARRLRARKPASLRTCVLLDKPSRRTVPFQADYVGFTIPDHFVVGYGLDYAERYRNLPFVGVLEGT